MNKQVLRLALPSIFANITIPLVGLVDAGIVGHVGNVTALAGIAVGAMLFDLLYWNFGFLRIGTGGMTAQAFGRKDYQETGNIFAQSTTLALLSAMFILTIQWLFVKIVLSILNFDPAVENFAEQYFFIRIWAAPAVMLLHTFKGWFIGMQNTIAPMACDLTVNIVNIFASYILACQTPLGAIGVAYGTVIAQYTGLLVGLCILLSKYKYILRLAQWRESIKWLKLKRLVVLNGNLVIRSLCFQVVYVGFTYLAGQYGEEELALSTIMMKLFMLYSYLTDGFAYAGEALVGKAIGAKSKSDMHRATRIVFYWSIGIAVVSTFIYAVWGDNMIAWMTDKEAILALAPSHKIWLIIMPVLSCFAFTWDGIYVGATAGKDIRNCMFFAALAFVLTYLCLWILEQQQRWNIGTLKLISGAGAVYTAYFAHHLARTLYLTIRWKPLNKTLWEKKD